MYNGIHLGVGLCRTKAIDWDHNYNMRNGLLMVALKYPKEKIHLIGAFNALRGSTFKLGSGKGHEAKGVYDVHSYGWAGLGWTRR